MNRQSTLRKQLPPEFSRHIRTGRQLVKARRRTPEEQCFATGSKELDELLRGGLRRGLMVELIGRRSSGRFSLVLAALAAATTRGEAAALVDLGDGLDPQSAGAAGVELERLLWARPRGMKEALISAEVILDSGIPLVILDLGMPPLRGGRGAEAFWLRLARAAARQRTALLISSPYRISGTAAHAVLEAQAPRASWRGRGLSPRLLDGFEARLELVKGPGWRENAQRRLGLRLPSVVGESLPPVKAAPAKSAAAGSTTAGSAASHKLTTEQLRSQLQSQLQNQRQSRRNSETPPPDPLMTTQSTSSALRATA